MDPWTRKLMIMHKVLYPRDDVDWLYMSRKEGERELVNIEDSIDALIQFKDYVEKHRRRRITATKSNTDNTRINRMEITRKLKCEEKQLYGRFKWQTSDISHKKMWTWLRKGDLYRETKSLQLAAWNDAIRTNYIKARIDKMQQNSRFRLCSERDKTINYILSECSKLAQKEYKTRHNWVGKVIQWELCKKFKFDHMNKWYMHNPASFLEN